MNPKLGIEFTLYRLPEPQTYIGSFQAGLCIVMFPFPRAGQAHTSDVPMPVHGVSAVLSWEAVPLLPTENRTMPELAGSTEVTIWLFPLSVSHWESAQIEHKGRIRGGIMELLQCGGTISSSMTDGNNALQT